MLKKLLKYDLKYMLKKMLPCYILVFIIFIMEIILKVINSDAIGVIVMIALMFTTVFTLFLYGGILKDIENYVWDNVYYDKSYFTYTLPISKKNIFIEKNIAILLTNLLIFLEVGIAIIMQMKYNIGTIIEIFVIVTIIVIKIGNMNLNIIDAIRLRRKNKVVKEGFNGGLITNMFMIFTAITCILIFAIYFGINYAKSSNLEYIEIQQEEIENLEIENFEVEEGYTEEGIHVKRYDPKITQGDIIDGKINEDDVWYYTEEYDANGNITSIYKNHDIQFYSIYSKGILLMLVSFIIIYGILPFVISTKCFEKGFDVV